MTKTRLAEIERDLANIGEGRRALDLAQNEAREKVATLTRQLSERVSESGKLDGAVKLEADLAAAEAKAASGQWGAKRKGLDARQHELERERTRVSTEGFDELAADLCERADELAAEVARWARDGAALRARWVTMEQAWMTLEQTIGGVNVKGRLAAPGFPYELPGIDVRPVPRVIEDSRHEQVAA